MVSPKWGDQHDQLHYLDYHGALIGWAASVIMHTNNRQGLIADIIVGIVSAFVGGYFLSPLFHVGTINQGDFSIPALLVTLGGAVILLAFSSCFAM